MSMRLRRVAGTTLALMTVMALAACGSAPPPAGGSGAAPGGSDAEALLQSKCTMCHTLDRVNEVKYDAAKWTATIERMEKNGAVLTGEEKQAIVDYLTQRDAQ